MLGCLCHGKCFWSDLKTNKKKKEKKIPKYPGRYSKNKNLAKHNPF
jgi:hypothetical protein